jgi:hypothetical protein
VLLLSIPVLLHDHSQNRRDGFADSRLGCIGHVKPSPFSALQMGHRISQPQRQCGHDGMRHRRVPSRSEREHMVQIPVTALSPSYGGSDQPPIGSAAQRALLRFVGVPHSQA